MINGRKVTAIIVARCGSSRFPEKVLGRIDGMPALSYMVERVRYSKLIDKIGIATSTSESDDKIAVLADNAGIPCFRGSETDVLTRLLGAARRFHADIIVYLTGDCPLIDPEILDDAIRQYSGSGCDFVCNYLPKRVFPNGVDVEVFSSAGLEKIDRELNEPWDREHVTGGFTDHQDKYKCRGLAPKKGIDRPDIRITLDEREDLERLQRIVRALKSRKRLFLTADIIQFLDKHPQLKGEKAAYEPIFTAAVAGLGMAGSLYDLKPAKDVWSHAGAFEKFGRIRLAAGCDPDKKKRDLFARRWGCEGVYKSPQEMFHAVRPDIVAIATPDAFHGPTLKLAVNAGVKAIICEKPISKDFNEARKMVELCRKNQIVLSVNHWHRWSELFRNARRFIMDEKAIGDIQHVVYWYSKGIFNSGSHVIDLLRWFFGDIEWVQSNDVADVGRPDPNVAAYIKFKKGFGCTLATADWRKFIMADFDIVGEKGRVTIDNAGNVKCQATIASRRFAGETEIGAVDYPYSNAIGASMMTAVKEMYDILSRGKGCPSCTGEDAMKAIQVISCLMESRGRKVYIR